MGCSDRIVIIITEIAHAINIDLALIQQPIRLQLSKYLAEITELAKDRKC